MAERPLPPLELTADAPAVERYRPVGRVSKQALDARRIIDHSLLRPGDLLLSANITGDSISEGIRVAQEAMGEPAFHAKYTHAMMYVGTDQTILEATFDAKRNGSAGYVRTLALLVGAGDDEGGERPRNPKLRTQGVFVSDLGEYCAGHSIRCRRPRGGWGWELVANALMMVGYDYDFEYIRRAGAVAMVQASRLATTEAFAEWRPEDYGDENAWGGAVVCSTLYSRAYTFTFDRDLAPVRGVCSPAFLSSVEDEHFQDVQLRWLEVG